MLSYLIIAGTALFAAGLTFFSGFGLGTILMPAFAVFFPVEIAIAATAVVHLANNLFKVGIIGKHANWSVVWRFGVAAAVAAFVGAECLHHLASLPEIMTYNFAGKACHITGIKVLIGLLMMVFAWFELSPGTSSISFQSKWLPVGGALSGFFGGLSGHQGALRTAFLIRLGMSKEMFIGSVAMCAVLVDVSRLIVYRSTFLTEHKVAMNSDSPAQLVLIAVVSAFCGTFIGSRMLHKVTLRSVQLIVAIMLFTLALGLIAGII